MEYRVIEKYMGRILAGHDLEFGEALELAREAGPAELYQAADELRQQIT